MIATLVSIANTKIQKVTNGQIREIMEIAHAVTDDIGEIKSVQQIPNREFHNRSLNGILKVDEDQVEQQNIRETV